MFTPRPVGLIASVVLALLAWTSPPASAQVSGQQGGQAILVSKMVVVGFDATVARQHGFTIKRDSSGRIFSVPTGAAATATFASPLASPILTGSCGSSYIHFNAIGLPKATLVTGFGLVFSAVFYGWHVHVIDGAGVGNLDWGGGLLLSRTWEASTVTHSSTTGYATAQVDTSSYATLANGAVCHSLGPWDYTYYY